VGGARPAPGERREEREVAEAYLAQKDVEDHPGVPLLLIVGLRVKRPWLKLVSRDADRRLAARWRTRSTSARRCT
jgi:hypothetical protein